MTEYEERNDGEPGRQAANHDYADLLWRDDAVAHVLDLRTSLLSHLDTESVPIEDLAGRVLAESIDAPADVPAHDHATMDGFAFNPTDGYPLSVRDGEVFPEDDPPELDTGEAIRIATGAPLPERATAVLKREDATVEGSQLQGPPLEPGTYVYEQGSNLAAGETLFEAGERLSAKDAILLGDLGFNSVSVRERLSVGVLATGTEIHEGRMADLDSPMLIGLIRSWGHDAHDEASEPDEYDRVVSGIERAASEHDVVVTTGGTSVGHKDHVIRALDSLGEVLFHRVRLRPGKPIAVASLPAHDAVALAIPGKPVGAHVVMTLVGRPLFTGEQALSTVEVTITRDVGLGTEGFEYAVPVTLEEGRAMPLGHADSSLSVYEDTFDPSVLSSSTRATRADGIVITTTDLTAGESVDVVPFSVLE